MLIPISINEMLDNIEIQELIGYSVFPDQAHINKAMEMYKSEQNVLLGYSLGSKIIGVIGYEALPSNSIRINHISVLPKNRSMSYGRLMISELIDLIEPHKIIAETDDDAVDFYRNIGFEITSLGEMYPSVERYECSFVTDFYRDVK